MRRPGGKNRHSSRGYERAAVIFRDQAERHAFARHQQRPHMQDKVRPGVARHAQGLAMKVQWLDHSAERNVGGIQCPELII